MRKLYLIRHAHPDFPLGAHMCLGRTDTPLGPLGRMQACLLGPALRGARLQALFSSPLSRCRQTAAPLGLPTGIVDELAEQDMGPWDGLDFTRIREQWPELYARRVAEPLLLPPGAESLAQVQRRVMPALERCLQSSEGDLAVVAHASVIQTILAWVCGIPLERSRALRPPYGSWALLDYDGTLRLRESGLLPELPLTGELAGQLLKAAAPGEGIEAHCRAVAAEALRIAEALPLALDRELLEASALLHDVARSQPEHARLGGAWLRELGYGDAAGLVEQHHDLLSGELNEAAVLYIADKLLRGDRKVPLEQRFRDSESKCLTDQARASHAARLARALEIQQKINRLCGRCVVE